MHTLSNYERNLMESEEVMRAKNRIIEVVGTTFSGLADYYQEVVRECALALPFEVAPKISRGEKYLGLPYLVLDYPRLFKVNNIFAVRTLFWWGNYCSTTLNVQGKYQLQFAETLQHAINIGRLDEWSIQTSGDMWQHEINEHYTTIEKGKDYALETRPFVKITKKIPLTEWDNIMILLKKDFQILVGLL